MKVIKLGMHKLSQGKILLVVLLGSVLLLSAISSNINSAEALKSKGTTNPKFGKDTSSIVCGDKLCSEIKKDSGRGDILQQEAGPEFSTTLHSFDFNLEQDFVFFDGDDGFLQLERNEFNALRIQSNQTNSLDALTLSAWIKPDFSRSFGEYTVVGKDKSFDLSVNNLSYPKKTAQFGTFDGITWTAVKSKSTLPESWFHIAAVYEGDSLSLFVNGKSEGTAKIKAIRMVDSDGRTVEKIIDKLTSKGDLSIGTYLSTSLQEGEKYKNRFNGKIDDVQILSIALNATEIQSIYAEDSSFYKDREADESLSDDSLLE